MAILSNNGGAVNLPPDLLKDSSAPTLNTDLYEVVITDLEPNSVVPIQFAWVYPDKTVSEYSVSYDLSTSDEATPNTPDFNVSNVEWGNGFLKITWNGKDTTGANLTNIKQVNIWMRGGTFGATSVKTAHFFTGAGTKTITLPSGTYYVKLQAETALGKVSAFSTEVQSTSFKKPAAVSALTAVWKKDDNTTKSNALKVNFTFDSTLETSTNSNLYATFFTIKLTGCTKSRSFSLPVDKSKTSHTWYLTPDMNKEFFGAFPFCGVFTVEVFVNDSFSLVSDSVTITSDTYTTPLDTPVITVVAEVLGYNVAYNSQDGKGFDQVYVYENLNLGAGWVQRTQGTSNPIRVFTSGAEPRDVKVIFYDVNGYSTAESNIVTGVIPKSADSTDTIPPLNSTATAAWNGNNIEITPTFASGEDSIRCIIELTANSQTRPFLKWKNELISGKFTITQDQLYSSFGAYYTSFNGTFKTADAAGNVNTGTSFSVASKTNPISAVTPTFALTAITNGYTATWVLPAAASYAKVYESGTSWGAGNPTESDLVFSGSSPAIIKKTVYTLRYVKIKYVTIDGFDSLWSTEATVTPIDGITVDINAPLAPSAGLTATPSIDTTGTMGFNGVINLSWTAVSDSTLRGYRIRFRPYKASAPFENYSYVDSVGTGTSYRLAGLAVGATYEIGIASYDEFNNTTGTYSSFTNQVIAGVPAMSNYITAGAAGFQFGSGIKDSTGSQNVSAQGIYLNNSNYWYITAADAGKFKVGGSAANFLEWTGAVLNVDGNITAKGGSFSGNIELKTTGASIWNGSLNSGGTLVGDGFVLNNNGLSIKKGSVNLRLDTSDGGIYAQFGQIAGWTIDSSKIERLTSTKYTGISSSGTYAFYAGATGTGNSGGDAGAEFWVKPDGSVKANNISITGGTLKVGVNFDVTSTGVLTATNGKFNGEITAASGTITGNFGVTTGTIYAGASATTGNRVVMNTSGVYAYDGVNVSTPSTSIISTAATAGGTTFKTFAAELGNWLVNSTSISNNGITITAPNAQGTTTGKPSIIATRGGYYVGIQTPAATAAASDVVLWAGLSSDGSGTPAFKVTADGKMYATSGTFSGDVNGSSFTSKSYASGEGIRIYSTTVTGPPARTFDSIEMFAGGSQMLAINANSSGAVIFGPSSLAQMGFTSSGIIQLTASSGAQLSLGTNTLLSSATASIMVTNSGYAYQYSGAGTSTGRSYRNIEASLLAPSLATGAAASGGYINGEIFVTY